MAFLTLRPGRPHANWCCVSVYINMHASQAFFIICPPHSNLITPCGYRQHACTIWMNRSIGIFPHLQPLSLPFLEFGVLAQHLTPQLLAFPPHSHATPA
jgi:hypothetical protein